jgi:hypothetical protein
MTLVRGLGIGALVIGVAALAVTGTLSLTDSDPGHVANSIITVAAALGVAFLTIVTTDQRQSSQLEHDANRHHETLAAESARQTARLQHERELRDRDEARQLIDEMAAHLAEVELAGHAAHITAASAADPSRDEDLVAEEAVPRAREAYSELQDLAIATAKWPTIFGARLGPADPVSRSVQELWHAIGQLGQQDSGGDRAVSGDLAAGLKQALAEFHRAQDEFMNAAYERTGVQLPGE